MSEKAYAHPRWERLLGLRQRTTRANAARDLREALISLAGLIGRPVLGVSGEEVGHLVDVVVNFSPSTAGATEPEPYPPMTGLIVRIGRRRSWVPAAQVERVTHGEIVLSSARIDLRDFVRRPGEVDLATRVLDHQLIDIDGRRVIRAADLMLASLRGELRLVGVDVSMISLLRRLGPARLRTRPTPDRVIDWSAIQPISGEGRSGGVRLRQPGGALEALRPGELADLLEELGRTERRQLLDTLDPATAADAVEEMDAGDVRSLLSDAPSETAAELLTEMEPDEAVDALRDLDEDERSRLLEALPADTSRRLLRLLGYGERRAGGLMTTTLAVCRESEEVAEVVGRLRELADHAVDLTAIAVVDSDGRLLDDVTVLELLLADGGQPMAELVGPPWPVTVGVEVPLSEVAKQLIDNRSASIVVVDDDGRPLGRILADDVLDALVSDRGRFQIFRLAP